MGRALVWKMLDPILRRLQSRLEHLARHEGPALSSARWGALGEIGPNVVLFPESMIVNPGDRRNLKIGAFSHIRGELNVLTPWGRLELGHHTFVGAGSHIWAQKEIRIGNHVMISHLVDIHDTNGHALSADLRREDCFARFETGGPIDWTEVRSAAVTIEDDVWIGFKSSILKGVTVGRGAIVAACSLVTKDVPALTLVAGSPARVVRDISGQVR